MLFRKLLEFVKSFIRWLFNLSNSKPKGLADPFVTSIEERFSMSREPDVMIYTLNLGPYDGDVEVRQVSIEVSGVDEVKVVNVSVEDNTVEVAGVEDAKATLKIVDIDNKGNKAPTVVFDIVLEDTVSPQPGAVVTVVSVKEITGKKIVDPVVPVEPVTPVVTEPVVTEPVVTEPVVTEPVVTEPVVTEPVVTEPVTPVTTEPTTEDTTVSKSAAKPKKPKKKE